MAMIGISPPNGCALMLFSTSKPLISGNCISKIIKSGGIVSACCSPYRSVMLMPFLSESAIDSNIPIFFDAGGTSEIETLDSITILENLMGSLVVKVLPEPDSLCTCIRQVSN